MENKTPYGYIAYYKNDQVFADGLKRGKIYEQDLVLNKLAEYVKRSKVILDVGSHAGSHTVLYKHLNPSALIYCFEPQKKMYDILCHNVSENKFNSVMTFNYAIGHKEMNFTMSNRTVDGENMNRQIDYGVDQRFNLGGLQVGHGGEEIEIKCIDCLAIPKVDYMKIDVEGFEPLVIMGAEKTIESDKPVISFEHNHKSISKSVLNDLGLKSIKSTEEMLKDFGYQINSIDNQGNFLALPS